MCSHRLFCLSNTPKPNIQHYFLVSSFCFVEAWVWLANSCICVDCAMCKTSHKQQEITHTHKSTKNYVRAAVDHILLLLLLLYSSSRHLCQTRFNKHTLKLTAFPRIFATFNGMWMFLRSFDGWMCPCVYVWYVVCVCVLIDRRRNNFSHKQDQQTTMIATKLINGIQSVESFLFLCCKNDFALDFILWRIYARVCLCGLYELCR